MYHLLMPGMDGKVNKHAVSNPNLVEATGLDGRFVGACRPFPGMADKTIHGLTPPTSGVTTIETIANILLVKYVSVQKGHSSDVLKGLAVLADNPGGTGKSLYFIYRDTSDGSTDVVELEDYDSWDDYKLTSFDEYDITSLGRYIYVTISADTTSNVTQWQNKETPYNKAYFWDYKINTWDKFVTGFDHRFMGLQPRRILGHPLNEDDDGSFVGDSADCFANEVYGPTGHVTAPGEYTYAVELISRKHNLRSYLRWHTETALGTPSSGLRYFIDEMNLPVDQPGATHQIKGNTHERTCIINWGIPHVDGFRLWRTGIDDTGAPYDKYTPNGLFYLVEEYIEKGTYTTGSGLLQIRFDHDSIIGTVFNDAKSSWFADKGLFQQTQYNAFLHEFHPAPRLKRIQAYDGLLVGITDVEEPTSPDDDWDKAEQIPEAIAWSILTSDEPENFPPEQQYRADEAAERFMSLEPAGDHLFGITNSSVYRVTRSGSGLGINRLQFRLGGVSRFGQTGVGNSLFIVTTAGLKQIDGNSGAINSVTALDRILLDDSEWAGSLADIHLEFDAQVGALILMNTTKKEAYILWESTGAVTKLEDIPWSHLTSGPDVLTDGSVRAYFVTDAGQIHTIDGARAMGKRSMCGTAAGETVNGTFTAGTTSTTLNDTDTPAVFPANCVGFKVHILSGDLQGESSEITVRNGDTQLTVSGFSDTPAVGDRYSVAPIVTRIVMPVLVGAEGRPDPFTRKIVKAFQASFSDLGGHTGTSDTNGKFRYGLRQMDTDLGSVEADFNIVPDKTVAALNRASTRAFPYLEFKAGNQDWELQAVLVHGVQSMSEAQSRQGTS
jgi:peptidoglycan hydrolase-like protein with peptidoglycan-binding domain